MAKAHSYLWRRPGRRDREREEFALLMARVEKIRLRDGLTQKAIAKEIGTTREIWRWFRGYAVGNKASIEKIKAFLRVRETDEGSGTPRRKSV
jgi:transcriptional regulator with XRE-family HTH domain